MRKPLQITPGGLAASVLVLLVAAVCVRLGMWQLERHEERRERSARVEARLALPPLDLQLLPSDTAGLLYRRVRVSGTFDHERPVVLPGRSHRGSPGVHLLTPLHPVGGGVAALVNRGWLPSADAATVDLSALETAGTVDVEGVVVPLPGRDDASDPGERPEGFPMTWYSMHLGGLPDAFPYPVGPYIVQAVPGEESGYPVRLPTPEVGQGPHMSYAFQWFSFGTIAVVGWLIIVARGGVRGAVRGRDQRA